MDQHLKVVREATWDARAKWQCLGEELGASIGKLHVRKCVNSFPIKYPSCDVVVSNTDPHINNLKSNFYW